MGLFDHTADRLSARTTWLLTADPGAALLAAARLYDPEVRPWHGRLVFRNGVLLFGPVTVTPKLEQQAGLPAGMAVAYYTAAAVQRSSQKRSHEAKASDGDLLVCGLAERRGETVRYAGAPPGLALVTSVYSERALIPEQVVEVLRPYGGDFKIEDQTEDSYSLSGSGTYFYVAYWDLHTGTARKHVARELVRRVGEASLALARQSGGVALDELGFPVSSLDDLLRG